MKGWQAMAWYSYTPDLPMFWLCGIKDNKHTHIILDKHITGRYLLYCIKHKNEILVFEEEITTLFCDYKNELKQMNGGKLPPITVIKWE